MRLRHWRCRCAICPPPPRMLRKCQLRKRYAQHRQQIKLQTIQLAKFLKRLGEYVQN
jgi:hypothetical protein